mmetsp:Transcript_2416/g.6297  ORF Transcript_2416/g.6297 Transcript_2416/m.6297 type:complete len:206 (-) Transcript_2416:308-925(-)
MPSRASMHLCWRRLKFGGGIPWKPNLQRPRIHDHSAAARWKGCRSCSSTTSSSVRRSFATRSLIFSLCLAALTTSCTEASPNLASSSCRGFHLSSGRHMAINMQTSDIAENMVPSARSRSAHHRVRLRATYRPKIKGTSWLTCLAMWYQASRSGLESAYTVHKAHSPTRNTCCSSIFRHVTSIMKTEPRQNMLNIPPHWTSLRRS